MVDTQCIANVFIATIFVFVKGFTMGLGSENNHGTK